MRDASESMKEVLRKDLRSAMRARSPLRVCTLRSLIAAIDNVQAVSVGDAHVRYVVRPFADGSAEVPRRALSAADVQRILDEELVTRQRAAIECEGHGKLAASSRLRAEAAIVAQYKSNA